MRFQYVKLALGAAMASLASACVTTASDTLDVVHATGPTVPTTLTRMEIARNYAFEQAAPLVVSGEADPSYAMAHEMPGLRVGDIRTTHADDIDQRNQGILLRAATKLPIGWSRTPDNNIRHDASGLTCPTAIELPEENRSFLLADLAAWDAKNLDIGCVYFTADKAALVLYASFWPQMSLEENVAGSVRTIADQFDLYGDLPISVEALDAERDDPLFQNIEQPRAGAFDIGEIDGVRYKTALWLVKTYGWHVKARATYQQDDMSSELVAAIMFAMSHLNVRAKNMNEPMAEGGEV